MSEKITDGSAPPDDEKKRRKRSIGEAVAEAMQDIDEQDNEDLALILGMSKPDADDEDESQPEQ